MENEEKKQGESRGHKNSVFKKLFEDPENLRALYGALTGRDYDDGTEIKVNNLDDVLFMNMKNDVSFTIDDKVVVLIEHQSTISENMPFRMLEYLVGLYAKIIDRKRLYRQKRVKIPTPEFIVFYNGKDNYPNESVLRLSDAFMENKLPGERNGGIDLEVRVLNINTGHNDKFVRKSDALHGYVTLVEKVREGEARGLGVDEALVEAIRFCIENGILQSFLEKHAREVRNMWKYDWEEEKEALREEAWEEGVEKGLEHGITEAFRLMQEGYSLEEAKSILLKEHKKAVAV